MVKIKNDQGNKNTAIRIKSIQANNLFRKNNGDQDAFLGAGNAMINNSLFAEYMRKQGVTVNTRNFSYDFIIMKFDFGIKGDENIPKMTENELRHYFYENGATVTWECSCAAQVKPKKEHVYLSVKNYIKRLSIILP